MRAPIVSIGFRRALRSAATTAVAAALLAPAAFAGGGSVDAAGNLSLKFHFKFVPTTADVARVKAQLQSTSQMLCDATEGRMKISDVHLSAGGGSEAAGDIWYFPFGSLVRSGNNGAPVHVDGLRIDLTYDAIRADVVTHELGHLVLGLGDQYDEQRRWGGPCGIGPSFDEGEADEQNHTIMQQLSFQRCVKPDGSLTNVACFDAGDCAPGETCPLSLLMSELSVHDNFDQRIGDSVLPANTCPAPRPGDTLELRGWLTTAAPVAAFDNTSLEAATSSAAGVGIVEFVDSIGAIALVGEGSSLPVFIFAERTAVAHAWTLHFAIDAGRTKNGTAGKLSILRSLPLTFDAVTGELATVDGTALTAPGFVNPAFDIVDLADNAADATLQVTFDTAGDDRLREGTGGLAPWQWLAGSQITAGGVQQLGACGETKVCEKKWNTMTNRWEATAVSIAYLEAGLAPLSDWEVLVQNVAAWYTLTWPVPAVLPAIDPPADCADAGNVLFTGSVTGADLVTLIIDRSDSMNIDRNNAGDVRTRLDWAKAGARVFADLQAAPGATTKVGFISFADAPLTELDLKPVKEDAAATATDHMLTAFKAKIDALQAEGLTAIGDTLEAARAQLNAAAAADPSLAKAVFLLTDGEQTAGSANPQTVADVMRNENIQIFAVPLGELTDKQFLSRIADDTGGALLESEDGLELPMVYAELYARLRGEAPVLPRTLSAVRGSNFVFAAGDKGSGASGQATSEGAGLPQSETFIIPVESGAERLNLVLSTRNDLGGTWSPAFNLVGPTDQSVNHNSPGVIGDDYYRIVRVPNPAPGNWQLTIAAQHPAAQFSYLLAHVENPKPDCHAGISPRTIVDGNAPVKITATASYPSALGDGVEYTATVRRPFGSVVTVPMAINEQHNGAVGTFDGFIGRGRYDVDVTCRVTDKARFAPGEHSTPEQLLRDPRPEPFVRHARTGFYVDSADLPALPAGGDGDHDGIPDGFEGLVDTDGDGLPDAYDQDADGDDVPDAKEGGGNPMADSDGDGIPDFRDPDSDNDGKVDGADPDSSPGGGGQGDSKLHFSFHVGSAHPLGDLDEEADANVYVQGDLGYRLTDRVDLVGRLGFAQLTEETSTTSDNQYWLHASLDAQVLFPTPTGLQWYLQAGPGWYDPKAGGGDFGINLGLGARLPLPGPFGLELGADYHHLFDDPKTRFLTIQLGVLFR